eukprot:COSAG06_NODE_1763_length_8449_cov_184.922275_4_plen_83_part_00
MFDQGIEHYVLTGAPEIKCCSACQDSELIKRMFEEADVDGGGSLDRQEVGKLLLRMNPALAAEAMRVDRCGNCLFLSLFIFK